MPKFPPKAPAFINDISVSETVFSEIGGFPQKALLYRPASEKPLPAVVCVHGGAWVSGDRHATAGFAELVAALGIVVLAIDTRLAPRHPYPAAVVDVIAGACWLKEHAEDIGVDPLRVGGLGVSSGGHLLLLAAMRPTAKAYLPDLPDPGSATDGKMAFVVTCSGVLDPLGRYLMAESRGDADILSCHGAFFKTMETMEGATPHLIIERGEKVELPPALFFQGRDDPRLPPDTAEKLANAWERAGQKAAAVYYENAAHSVGTWPRSALLDMLWRIQEMASAQDATLSASK